MRNIFIADAHLKNPADANYRSLLRFLETLPPDTDTLYILGDLFEFWLGSPEPVYRHYREVIDCLKGVRRRGVRLVYFEGNHDFHLSRFFENELQAEVHRQGAVLTMGGQRVYLCHGDQINRKDYRYRAFRLVLHSRLAGALLPLFPRGLAGAVAARLSKLSGRRHKVRRVRWDRRSITLAFAKGCFVEGCDAVVTGHFHLPYLEREGNRVVVSLGDWISHFSYCEWLDGEFTLKSFS